MCNHCHNNSNLEGYCKWCSEEICSLCQSIVPSLHPECLGHKEEMESFYLPKKPKFRETPVGIEYLMEGMLPSKLLLERLDRDFYFVQSLFRKTVGAQSIAEYDANQMWEKMGEQIRGIKIKKPEVPSIPLVLPSIPLVPLEFNFGKYGDVIAAAAWPLHGVAIDAAAGLQYFDPSFQLRRHGFKTFYEPTI